MEGSKESNNILKTEISKSLSGGSKLSDIICRSDKSTILHIAAGAGHLEVIASILQHDQGLALLCCQNSKGDLPIHVALEAGQKDAVTVLVGEGTQEEGQLAQCGNNINQLKEVNSEQNTALHIALQNQFKDLALGLFRKCPQTAYCFNAQGICPLYLAIEAGYFDLARDMLQDLGFNPEVQKTLKDYKQ